MQFAELDSIRRKQKLTRKFEVLKCMAYMANVSSASVFFLLGRTVKEFGNTRKVRKSLGENGYC